jgi:Tol biopolymer transport system component
VLHSTIEIVPIGSKDRRVMYHSVALLEAPNWTKDGQSLLFNSRGRIFRLPVRGGTPVELDTGFANRCNNDHGLSPDGKDLAISDQSRGGKSMIYTVSIEGGSPKQITSLAPSYWHGWSPDGSTLAYCAERNSEFDVYTIPAAGGEERRDLLLEEAGPVGLALGGRGGAEVRGGMRSSALLCASASSAVNLLLQSLVEFTSA